MLNSENCVEVLKDRLFWLACETPPRNIKNAFYFNVDERLAYQPIAKEEGPLTLCAIIMYCRQVQRILSHPQLQTARIYHCTSTQPAIKTNAALLCCAFQVLVKGKTAQQAIDSFRNVMPTLIGFRDALQGPATYLCKVIHCLKGIQQAVRLGWLSFKGFDVVQHISLYDPKNGDLSWIIPGQLAAFSSPTAHKSDSQQQQDIICTPQDYVDIFYHLGVNTVVRLNQPKYDALEFTESGIKHFDIYFKDGSTPTDGQIDRFVGLMKDRQGAVAVHCMAGLGRTGTLIACYLIKAYALTPQATIAYIRMCRPGCVLGPQQAFVLSQSKCLIK